jgi:D-alanine-D-alanine ligase-like ATP-grasp enzyme
MTDTSLLPKAAEAAGIPWDDVVQQILDLAALGL